MTTSAVSALVIAILVYRSTLVKIALNPFETGRSVKWTREMDCHCLEVVMVSINHVDDVVASLLRNMYHMSEDYVS